MTDDEAAIRKVIAEQFGSLNWRPGTSGAWAAFMADFLPGAPLYAAAHPVKSQTAEAFVERMKGLAESKLRSFATGDRDGHIAADLVHRETAQRRRILAMGNDFARLM